MPQATKQQLDAMAVADSLRPTLLRLARELRREKIAGVSPHQVGLLVAIKYAPGVTVGELAAEERVSTAAMSKRVSRLERDGLVARTKSEADRRCIGLTLTEDGQRTLRRVRSRRTAWLASRLGDADAGRARRGGSGRGAARAPPRRRRAARVTKAAKRTFHSLRYRNYRLFFGGQIVSQTGSWMQRIALGWYVLQLTHSPFDVGVMAFAQFFPYMLFGLFAGVLADRLDARRTVIGTQTAQLISASALAWIALGGFAEPWMLYTIAFINGTVLVLDVPSRQQLTYRMVGRDDLPNAIALNSTLFNASRIFGPAVAGVVLVAGAGICFLTNAISYLAVLLCLLAMRVSEFFPLQEFERPRILAGTREGLAWIRRQPRMLILLSLVFVISTFCFNFNVTLPVLAKVTLNGHAYVYGLLSAAFGVGALVGALAAASLGARLDEGAARRRAALLRRASSCSRLFSPRSWPASCSSSSARASPPGRRTRTRSCSSPRPTTCAAA